MVLPLQEAIKHAASLLCEETFVLTHLCHKIITKYLSDITLRILNDKSPQAICMKLGMCRPDIGEYTGDSRDSFLEGPGHVPKHVQHGITTWKYICYRESH